jgi:hypothetical protein
MQIVLCFSFAYSTARRHLSCSARWLGLEIRWIKSGLDGEIVGIVKGNDLLRALFRATTGMGLEESDA